jgi:hypothetical protein
MYLQQNRQTRTYSLETVPLVWNEVFSKEKSRKEQRMKVLKNGVWNKGKWSHSIERSPNPENTIRSSLFREIASKGCNIT